MKRDIEVIILLVIGAFAFAAFLGGCAGGYVPPVSVSAGFFGASVTVSEPGFTVPAKVVPTQSVAEPTLMLPPESPVNTPTTTVTTATGSTVIVPVLKEAEVTAPVLAVPAK